MAQSSINLNNLLIFQGNGSPSVVAEYFSNTNGWTTDHSVFTDTRSDYDWYEAEEGEGFEPQLKDRLLYSTYGSYEPVIIYITEERNNYDAILSEIAASGMTQVENRVVTGLNYYAYANEDQVIEVYEPLVPHNGRLNHTFIVYAKSDFEKGFRVR